MGVLFCLPEFINAVFYGRKSAGLQFGVYLQDVMDVYGISLFFIFFLVEHI